jgi:MbtH protein
MDSIDTLVGYLQHHAAEHQDKLYSRYVFSDRQSPLGWREVGKTGPKAECLAYIKEVWTDMRPLSLRKKMEESQKNKQ